MNEIKFAHQIESAISGNSLLGLPGTAERKELAAQSSLFAISKNEALYRTGDAADCGWAVISGQIKVVKQSHSGHQRRAGDGVDGEGDRSRGGQNWHVNGGQAEAG